MDAWDGEDSNGADWHAADAADPADWSVPVGLDMESGPICFGAPMRCELENYVARANQLKPKAKGDIESLEELPKGIWTAVPNNQEGTQFFTRVKVGEEYMRCMLDGGSQVNSITEEQVCAIMNDQKAREIKLDDPKHPIIQLEKRPQKECVRGVAGGKTVPLLGAVVMCVIMCKREADRSRCEDPI